MEGAYEVSEGGSVLVFEQPKNLELDPTAWTASQKTAAGMSDSEAEKLTLYGLKALENYSIFPVEFSILVLARTWENIFMEIGMKIVTDGHLNLSFQKEPF